MTDRQIISVIGRSLIRTFLASAAKDAAISSKVLSKLRRKKSWIDLVLSERMITFAPDDEP